MKIGNLNSKDYTKHIGRSIFMIAKVYVPTKLAILFLSFFWLFLRYLFISSNSNNDISSLLGFVSIAFIVFTIIYFLCIIIKMILFLLKPKKRYTTIAWIYFSLAFIMVVVLFKGYLIAGSSLSDLAQGQMQNALKSFSILLNEYKFLPAMPVVTGVFSTVIEWSKMPVIQSINVITLTIGFVSLSIFGLYSFYWRILPKHISIGSIVFGIIGSILLISYISHHAIATNMTNGKLIIRLLITICFSIMILMLYLDYYKKAVDEFRQKNDKDGAKDSNENVLEEIESKATDFIYLPPSPVETGVWIFFGLVVLGDIINNI